MKRAEAILRQLQPNVTSGKADASSASLVVKNGVGIITLNSPPVNSFSPALQRDLTLRFREATESSAVKAIVITGTGGFFLAGADIPFLKRMQDNKATNGSAEATVRTYLNVANELLSRIESGPKPTVAAVNGAALGGGLELAMACNARVVSEQASFGLPELRLGIIPAFGGTQRLPRLVGVAPAVDMTLKSQTINPKKASQLGLVDKVVSSKTLLEEAVAVALQIVEGKIPRRQSLYLTEKIGKDAGAVITAARAAVKKDPKSAAMPQLEALLSAVEAGVNLGGLKGLQKETDIMISVFMSPSARSLVHMFLAQKATAKVPGIPSRSSEKLKRVAVLGGGTMGSGIVAVYLLKGYHVILKEVNDKFLAGGVQRVTKIIQRQGEKDKLSPEGIKNILDRMSPQLDYKGFDQVDLVIEAVLEDIPLKQKIFAELEKICKPDCILSSNTSTIDLTLIGANTKAQSRILGLHFFSPAHVMPLLEIVRTEQTSPDVLGVALDMARRIGKTGVIVGNCVGFTANRVFFPYGQAAGFLVDRGVDLYRIDKALLKFGMPMGVFQMSDLSGIDIFSHVSKNINSAYGERCYNATMGNMMMKENRLGQKTGAGYYKYADGKSLPDPEGIAKYVKKSREDAGNPDLLSDLTDQDIVDIILLPVVNECYRVIAEGHVASESDVDIISITGYGFPAFRGGILFWAREYGLQNVARRLHSFANVFGLKSATVRSFFEPCSYLQRLAVMS